ncbi:unnamed protein product [Auanema sp. JU1783]|nr:unnamed protein product [Auanema sp. JU1783]
MLDEFDKLSISGTGGNGTSTANEEGSRLDRFNNTRKEPAKQRRDELVLTTNLYKIQTEDRLIYRYDVHHTLVIKNGGITKKEIDLTPTKANSDVQRNTIRLGALNRVITSNQLLSDINDYCYDGAATMFSVSEMNFSGQKVFEIDAKDLAYVELLFKRNADDTLNIRVALKSAGSPFSVGDDKVDQNIRKQFLEIVTSFPLLRGNFFEMNSSLIAFQLPREMLRDLTHGLESRCGLSKSVKFTEGQEGGPSRSPVPHLNLDVSNSVFYQPCSAMGTAKAICKRYSPRDRFLVCFDQLDSFFKEIKIVYDYNGKQFQFKASGTTQKPLKDLSMDQDGKRVRFVDMLEARDRENFDLNFPAVIMKKMFKGKLKEYLFPLEQLYVADFQKLPIAKNCIDPPAALKTEVRIRVAQQYMAELGISNPKSSFHGFLKNFGVRIAINEVKVTGFKKMKPKIVYNSNREVNPRTDNGTWRIDDRERYIVPGKCNTIFFAYRCDPKLAKEASEAIVSLLKARGFIFNSFQGVGIRKFSDLEDLFISAKSTTDFNFIVFFDAKFNKDHDHLKLIEREFQVASQQIVNEVAMTLMKRPNTLSNIVNKINLKCGGLNHSIIPDSFSRNRWLNKGNMLVMGYDVAHPTGNLSRAEKFGELVTPSVVGFSWNGAIHPEGFVGDFAYQEPRRESVNANLLNTYVKYMLAMFTEAKPLPQYFIIVRDGVSEGQYAMVLREEFECIKEACEEFARISKTDWIPKFMIFVVTKRHNVRFYQNKNGGLGNCEPGTVADTVIVKRDVSEFYMLSHRVVQGTGKFPSYQILLDEIDMSMDEAQSLMHTLTYNHQIIEAPISLPEPVYQADRWADRGSRIFRAWQEQYKIPRTKDGVVDFARLSEMLSYRNTRLAKTRINA